VGAGGGVQPDALVVVGDGETEAVPAGLAERGPQGVSLLDDLPYPAGSRLADLVAAVMVLLQTWGQDAWRGRMRVL
jgi:hypothetical protein